MKICEEGNENIEILCLFPFVFRPIVNVISGKVYDFMKAIRVCPLRSTDDALPTKAPGKWNA